MDKNRKEIKYDDCENSDDCIYGDEDPDDSYPTSPSYNRIIEAYHYLDVCIKSLDTNNIKERKVKDILKKCQNEIKKYK